jgi:hypothetical protein
MIKTAIIEYAGAKLEVPEFLVDIWPKDFQLKKWPTFCGAGDGLGDKIVPDHICGVRASCCCFEHDISWPLSANTFFAFMRCNMRFYRNLRALVLANYDKKKHSRFTVERRCFYFFAAVCTAGWKFFKVSPDDRVVTVDPFSHPVVKARLHRLARVYYGIPGFGPDGEIIG